MVAPNDKIPVVAVVGPTASGKTKLAIAIAKHFGGEVVSADSMQVYRGMDIASAKPTPEEMEGVPHHLIDFLELGTPFSVADYAVLAHAALAKVYALGKLPVLAGGTGLYVDMVLEDIRFSGMRSDPILREELASQADREGSAALLEELRAFDPEIAETLHANNLGRVIRAIEVYRLTGIPMSEHRKRSRGESRYRALKIGLTCADREVLYDRINARVETMLERGLLEDARRALDSGGPTALQAIGCKEFAGYFSGKVSLEEAVEAVKRETRRYAKRQVTWFKRDPSVQWFFTDREEISVIQKNILSPIESFLNLC